MELCRRPALQGLRGALQKFFSSSEAGRLRLERAAHRLGARDPAAVAQSSSAAQEELMRPLVLKPEVIRSEAAASAPADASAPTENNRGDDRDDREGDDERMRDMEPTDGEDEDQDMGSMKSSVKRSTLPGLSIEWVVMPSAT